MSKPALEQVAGNGLMNRRHLLGLGLSGLGAVTVGPAMAADSTLNLQQPGWSMRPGPGPSAYGEPSSQVDHIQRSASGPDAIYPGGGVSRTPLQHLQGSLTPNSLHFERHHAGVPDIDPNEHKLVINGLVRQPLVFSYESLLRYPMISRVYFLECSGNSRALLSDGNENGTAQSLHGLLSAAEWTGIPLGVLLEEAGVETSARWLAAVGADAASMGRSIPIEKALDDVLVALFQNGEPVRPEQGYPMRLFVPGWEGNVSVKWLTQLKLTESPVQFRDETSKYTDTLPDRSSIQFSFPMGVKSVITHPSGQTRLGYTGLYQISGLAWSGHGRIRRVEVSADGGNSWADALLDSAGEEKALTRFRIPWQWNGGPANLMSRAIDSAGNTQPGLEQVRTERGPISFYHNNGIQNWGVNGNGEVRNVIA